MGPRGRKGKLGWWRWELSKIEVSRATMSGIARSVDIVSTPNGTGGIPGRSLVETSFFLAEFCSLCPSK